MTDFTCVTITSSTSERLYVGNRMFDKQRRYALTWVGGANEDAATVWELISLGAWCMVSGGEYKLRNKLLQEFLYVASSKLDPTRRYALTWAGDKTNRDPAMVWHVAPTLPGLQCAPGDKTAAAASGAGGTFTLRHKDRGELLYTGSKLLDQQRRLALTWGGDPNGDVAMEWTIAPSNNSSSRGDCKSSSSSWDAKHEEEKVSLPVYEASDGISATNRKRPLNSAAKFLLAAAHRIAARQRCPSTGTEHLLLALCISSSTSARAAVSTQSPSSPEKALQRVVALVASDLQAACGFPLSVLERRASAIAQTTAAAAPPTSSSPSSSFVGPKGKGSGGGGGIGAPALSATTSPSLARSLELAVELAQRESGAGPEHLVLGALLAAFLNEGTANSFASAVSSHDNSTSTHSAGADTTGGGSGGAGGSFPSGGESATAAVVCARLQEAYNISSAQLVRVGEKCPNGVHKFGFSWDTNPLTPSPSSSSSSSSSSPTSKSTTTTLSSADTSQWRGPVNHTHWALLPAAAAASAGSQQRQCRVLCGRSAGLMSEGELKALVTEGGVDTFLCLQTSYTEYGCADYRATLRKLSSSSSSSSLAPSSSSSSSAGATAAASKDDSSGESPFPPHRVNFLHCPVPDFGVLSDGSLLALVAELQRLLLSPPNPASAAASVAGVGEEGKEAKGLPLASSFSFLKQARRHVLYIHCMGGHGRTGTVVANLIQAVEGVGFKEAMGRLRERHCQGRAACRGGHCALGNGDLEDESQEAQAKRLVPAMSRQHAINK